MPYLGAADLHPATPRTPRCCCCGTTPDRKTLSPVHLRLTPRFPFLWLHRGRAPRSWLRSCLAVLRADPTDPDAGRHYLCLVCLPLARAVPASTPTPSGVQGALSGAAGASPRDEPSAPACPPAPASGTVTRAAMDGGVRQHVLELRQVFRLETVVNGTTAEGHRGIELARGSATVRCRACGQEVARVADLASGTPWDAPHYEYTPAGLCVCPNAQSAVS